jgi:hypothetical protein
MPRRKVEPVKISKSTMALYHYRFSVGPCGIIERNPESSMEVAHQMSKRVDLTGEETVALQRENYLREKEDLS